MPTISITVSAADGNRVLAAYSRILGRSVTLADVKALLSDKVRADVKASELIALREALTAPDEITVT